MRSQRRRDARGADVFEGPCRLMSSSLLFRRVLVPCRHSTFSVRISKPALRSPSDEIRVGRDPRSSPPRLPPANSCNAPATVADPCRVCRQRLPAQLRDRRQRQRAHRAVRARDLVAGRQYQPLDAERRPSTSIDAIEDSALLLIDPPSHQRIVDHVPGYAARVSHRSAEARGGERPSASSPRSPRPPKSATSSSCRRTRRSRNVCPNGCWRRISACRRRPSAASARTCHAVNRSSRTHGLWQRESSAAKSADRTDRAGSRRTGRRCRDRGARTSARKSRQREAGDLLLILDRRVHARIVHGDPLEEAASIGPAGDVIDDAVHLSGLLGDQPLSAYATFR